MAEHRICTDLLLVRDIFKLKNPGLGQGLKSCDFLWETRRLHHKDKASHKLGLTFTKNQKHMKTGCDISLYLYLLLSTDDFKKKIIDKRF